MLEERTSGGLRDGDEFLGLTFQRGGEGVGGGVGELGGTRFDDDQHCLTALGEGVVDGVIEGGPGLVVFDEAADVGVDLEVIGNIVAAQDREDQREHDDAQWAAHRPGDETDDR